MKLLFKQLFIFLITINLQTVFSSNSSSLKIALPAPKSNDIYHNNSFDSLDESLLADRSITPDNSEDLAQIEEALSFLGLTKQAFFSTVERAYERLKKSNEKKSKKATTQELAKINLEDKKADEYFKILSNNKEILPLDESNEKPYLGSRDLRPKYVTITEPKEALTVLNINNPLNESNKTLLPGSKSLRTKYRKIKDLDEALKALNINRAYTKQVLDTKYDLSLTDIEEKYALLKKNLLSKTESLVNQNQVNKVLDTISLSKDYTLDELNEFFFQAKKNAHDAYHVLTVNIENIPTKDIENIPTKDIENIPTKDIENIQTALKTFHVNPLYYNSKLNPDPVETSILIQDIYNTYASAFLYDYLTNEEFLKILKSYFTLIEMYSLPSIKDPFAFITDEKIKLVDAYKARNLDIINTTEDDVIKELKKAKNQNDKNAQADYAIILNDIKKNKANPAFYEEPDDSDKKNNTFSSNKFTALPHAANESSPHYFNENEN